MSKTVGNYLENYQVDEIRLWEYELTPGNWVLVKDDRINYFYEKWQKGDKGGYVYHCFGDGMKTEVNFDTMTSSCVSAHQCNDDHNRFNIRFISNKSQ